MLQHLKMAIREQKRLVLIFLLAIFLPSVTLGVFSLFALRNEKYRIERQFQEEQHSFIDSIKSSISYNITTLDKELNSLVHTAPFSERNYPELLSLIEKHLEQHQLTDQFFITYHDRDPWFPPFVGPGSGYPLMDELAFAATQAAELNKAETLEFRERDYRGALTILEKMMAGVLDQNLQAQVLNLIARNHMKLGEYEKAIEVYQQIIVDYPDSKTSSGTFLPVTARFQLINCYLEKGLIQKALITNLEAYQEILHSVYELSETQFSMYTSLVQDRLKSLFNSYSGDTLVDSTYIKDFEYFNVETEKFQKQWQVINNLKRECIPGYQQQLNFNNQSSSEMRHYTTRLDNEDYVMLFCQIPEKSETGTGGFAGIKINSHYLEDTLLPSIISTYSIVSVSHLNESLRISDMNGRLIFGKARHVDDVSGITSLFESNIPPWRITMSGHPTGPYLIRGIVKSYYFWAILSMMAILGFGVLMLGRMIAQEREVLKLKSEFVSSVSHEFKTPITSIMALTERLLKGNMKDPNRMREYYQTIARDAENLRHLVGNILDYSKIEDGKKIYQIEETNIKDWLEEVLKRFFRYQENRKYILQTRVRDQVVPVLMDRGAMQLAINNLLDNAVKYSASHTDITVSLDEQATKYLLQIRDEGIGIPVPEQSRIFEKFYRGKYASENSITGTGLGLAIVKQVIEGHGGVISLESSPGKGSTFIINLPINNTSP